MAANVKCSEAKGVVGLMKNGISRPDFHTAVQCLLETGPKIPFLMSYLSHSLSAFENQCFLSPFHETMPYIIGVT